MKEDNLSADVVSTRQNLHAERSSARTREDTHAGEGGEPCADELATALAMMHATLESTTDAILVTDEANYVREFNEKYVRFWGIPPHMMISAHAGELWNYVSPQLKDPAGYLARVQEIIALAAPETFDVLQLKDGRVFEQSSAMQLIKQRNVGRVWSFRDITQRKRAQDALANEKTVLEKIASGASLATVLDVLVRGVEAQSCDGMMCTVLVFDEAAQSLRHGAAPSVPAEYNRIVDGVHIGPCVGSCGSAAYKREPVFATDIATDPHWADYAELAATFGLGACCSTPVFSSEGALLGTVAMYYRNPHQPSEHDRELIRMATHLAGIVIERARAVEQLRLAKVAAEQRAQDITQAYDTLRTTQQALNAELAGAVDYVMSLLPRPITEERLSADWFMVTSAQLGGDGLGYHWIDAERFAFYLLDVSGHGVKSALLAVSIIDTLRTCGLADTDWNDPGAVLRALNRVYFSQSHDHLYFTIWYGIADLAHGTLRYAGGGHPPAVVRAAGCRNPKLGASGPPVGCFGHANYPTLEVPLLFPTELYLFSDGVFETRRQQETASFDRLVEFLAGPGNGDGPSITEIRNRTLEHLNGALPPDDCSVLKVSIC
ncbi:MAG: GAF domain-containing SpoIIE family protein phosphatase [Candidatus Udaeobacter sp.]